MGNYKLLFANQSIYTKTTYHVVRETKCYLFLKENGVETSFIFKVHKKTLNVVGQHMIQKYTFEVPQARHLVKIN